MSIKDGRWEAMRLQNLAAIVFNGFSAIAALMYVLAGGSSVIGWLILVAAIGFTIGLLVLHSRHGWLSALTSP
jgi:hypothetical protein